VNPLTWADLDDVTFNLAGGIAASPLNFSANGACEVHNIGEIWCNTLWEVRSRIIADPAGANGDVPTGNNTMLQIVTDGMKMTPINPSFIDARDALFAADAAAHGSANELSIWQGFADRGLGYKAVAPFSRMFGWAAGHVSIGESFDVPYLDVESVAIDDSLGNNNGAIDPGEPVKITVKLQNPWRKASFGVASATAKLITSTPDVTITTGSATYPAIPALGSADGTQFGFTLALSATPGQALQFTITPTSTLGTKAVDFTLRVGTPAGNGAPITYARTIPGGLAIPDNAPRGVVDTFTITDDNEIADLNFRIDSLTHTAVGDLTVLLRAPNGLGTDLISALGGGSDGGPGNNFADTVIDDQASGDLLMVTAASAPFTGSWKPVFNNASWDGFGFPHDLTGTLGRYAGLSTKGDWKVLVSDQGDADTGTLNAWSLIVTPKAYTVTPFVPSDVTISGTVRYYPSDYPPSGPSAKTVGDTTINLTGDTNLSTLTLGDGSFSVPGLAGGGTYDVTPVKTTDSPTAKGVDSFDQFLIQRHILGRTLFDSPYERLAADVDGAGNIDSFDQFLIQRLILGRSTEFPLGLWRFVPADYVFPDANNPWAAPTNLWHTNLVADVVGEDFVAIKLGDVDNGWTMPVEAASLVEGGADRVSAASLAPEVVFRVDDLVARPGERVKVGVSVRDFSQVASAQFTLMWNPDVLRYVGVGDQGLKGASFGTSLVESGKLMFAWYDAEGVGQTMTDGTRLFALNFEVLGEGGNVTPLELGDSPTERKVWVDAAVATFRGESGHINVVEPGPFQVRDAVAHAGTFQLSVLALEGRRYVLEFTDKLPATNWIALTGVDGDGKVLQLVDPSATNQQRFYRVRVE